MKIIRITIIALLLILLSIVGISYYASVKIAGEINAQYASKKIPLGEKGLHVISFKEIKPSGFPFNLTWDVFSMDIIGLKEETKDSKVTYSDNIKVGYNLLMQNIFAKYSGKIKFSNKDKKSTEDFTAELGYYSIIIDFPITTQLFYDMKSNFDPVKLVNHIGDLSVYAKNTKLIDSKNNKVFDKEYEKINFSFLKKKNYESFEDIINNIPQIYNINYTLKNNKINSEIVSMPVSVFYIFSAVPLGVDTVFSTSIKTSANKIVDIQKGLEIASKLNVKSTFFSIKDYNFKYTTSPNPKTNSKSKNFKDQNIKLDVKGSVNLKKGFFDMAFSRYHKIKPRILTMPSGEIVNREIEYLMNNKKDFRIEDLEDRSYRSKLILNSYLYKNIQHVKIVESSIFSEKSGFKLEGEMKLKDNHSFKLDGQLFVQKYKDVVDFTSGYAYRLGKFKSLSKEARELYIDVNSAMLKKISNYPDSKSEDIIVDFSLDSANLFKAKIGNVKLDEISQIYKNFLYTKLVGKVGVSGDIAGKMKSIIPGLNLEDAILKRLLSKLPSKKKDNNKKDPNPIGKIIGKELGKELNKNLKKKDFSKDLLKHLLQ